MHKFSIDSDSTLVKRQYALVYTRNKKRSRFPENCVQIVDSKELAITGADPEHKPHAALIFGPSRSSEGFRLYYLVEWLSL
ncbi:MAG: hypothetical protein GY792_26415 [Gammaproteobacteria bacterium]|nr:hypothetical protein [Gammaproteobacteria bacterium]